MINLDAGSAQTMEILDDVDTDGLGPGERSEDEEMVLSEHLLDGFSGQLTKADGKPTLLAMAGWLGGATLTSALIVGMPFLPSPMEGFDMGDPLLGFAVVGWAALMGSYSIPLQFAFRNAIRTGENGPLVKLVSTMLLLLLLLLVLLLLLLLVLLSSCARTDAFSFLHRAPAS